MSVGRFHDVRQIVWALVWIVVGAVLWLANRGIIQWRLNWDQDWPAIFVIIGVVMLARHVGRARRQPPDAASGRGPDNGQV